MSKKILFLSVSYFIIACSSNRKLDYIIIDSSLPKKPIWVNNISNYEKNKKNEADKYKYFASESESINKRTCEQSAIANRNKIIASEIYNTIDSLYTGTTEVKNEEIILSDNKKEETKNLVKGKLVGVELKESYWEKRKYSTELGAEKDKLSYYCYQLARVKKNVHDKIVNEMINKKLQEIKNPKNKEDIKKSIEENAEKYDIDVEVK